MEYQRGADARNSLRLVNAGGETVWEPDPAADTAEMDALAELFIGDEPAERVSREVPRREAAPAHPAGAVEAVITGHLPVRGAVWVRAYAAAVSRRERRPVALVRVTGDRTTVELVGSAVATEPVRDIGLAIEAVSSATEHFLLHFDELDQAGLLREETVNRVTVLSGADEPAVVSAYRLLKSVCDDRGDAVAEGGLDVGVSIVGSGADETVRATDRLGVAARRFLSIGLSSRAAVPKIETATVSVIGEVDRRSDPRTLLGTIASCVDEGWAAPDCPASAVASALGETEASEPGPGADAALEPDPEPRVDPGTGWSAAPLADAAPPSGAAESIDRPLPSSLIAGLTGMDLPCPVARGVELATDGAGGLHLLAWWDSAAPAELLKARVWAGVNLPLLARLGPIDASKRHAVMHVVCDSVGAAADLRGGELRVHLAQPVTAATANGWVTTPVE